MNELDRLEEDAKRAMETPGFGMYANPAVVLDLIARLRAAEFAAAQMRLERDDLLEMIAR